MLGSYVCKQCRTRLSQRIVPARNPQWQPRATFLSLRNQKAKDQDESAQLDAQPQHEQEEVRENGQLKLNIRYEDPNEQAQSRTQAQRPAGRYSRHLEDDAESGRPPLSPSQTEFDRANGDQPATKPLERGHGPASIIEDALSRKDLNRAWRLFEDNYTSKDCKALMEPSLSDIALLNNGRLFTDLLREVSGAFCARSDKPAVTPTEVLFRYEQLDIATPKLWTNQAISFLTHQAILAVNAPPGNSTRDLVSILSELLSVWRLFFQYKGVKQVQKEAISKDWNLPAVEDVSSTYLDTRDFILRLADYHPGQVGNSTLSFCAVYLYTLSDSLKAVESLQNESEPFVQFLGRLLAGASVHPVFSYTRNAARFAGLPEEVKKEIIKEVGNAPHKAMSEFGSQGASLGKDKTGDRAADLENFHLKRISRAVLSTNSADELNRLWTEMLKVYTKNAKTAIPDRIYNAFLQGYMILFQAQRSVDVWNHMVAHGSKPGIQSWVALLDGCAKAKDLNGFNAIWTRMLNAGIEPDNYAWTTRVHGLMSLRQLNLGLAALDDMGKRWISAETVINKPQTHSRNRKGAKNLPSSAKTINRCTKPSIEVINGAITALVQLPETALRHQACVEHIQKILTWAGNFNIKPDAVTFNSMIQLYIRAADYATAFKVLRQMEKSGVEADLATHTMLLNVAFDNRSFDSLSEDQQTEKIIGLFNDLEAGGLQPNDYVYATAINRLLKQYSNHNAVRQVIEHMRKRGKYPGSHIYVSLVTHYFQQDPPAIAAVDSLVDQLFKSLKTATDPLLFDRIIEGYATHGEIGKMMSVLTLMSKHNRSPSWKALIAVVEALATDHDYDRIRDIARDVQSGTNIAKGRIQGGRMGEWTFFHKVKALGIVLQEERMGDFMVNDRAIRASGDDAVLGNQLREQEIQQMTQKEEVQEDLNAHQPASTPRYQQQGTTGPQSNLTARYRESAGSAQSDPEPGNVPAEEDDVHGFLKDEHEDIHSRVNKP